MKQKELLWFRIRDVWPIWGQFLEFVHKRLPALNNISIVKKTDCHDCRETPYLACMHYLSSRWKIHLCKEFLFSFGFFYGNTETYHTPASVFHPIAEGRNYHFVTASSWDGNSLPSTTFLNYLQLSCQFQFYFTMCSVLYRSFFSRNEEFSVSTNIKLNNLRSIYWGQNMARSARLFFGPPSSPLSWRFFFTCRLLHSLKKLPNQLCRSWGSEISAEFDVSWKLKASEFNGWKTRGQPWGQQDYKSIETRIIFSGKIALLFYRTETCMFATCHRFFFVFYDQSIGLLSIFVSLPSWPVLTEWIECNRHPSESLYVF